MITTLILVAASATALSSAPDTIVVLARDGSLPITQAEQRVLSDPTSENIQKLVDEGRILIKVEDRAALVVDPLAPPLRQAVIENRLLRAFSDFAGPKSFADLDTATQRTISDLIEGTTPDVAPNGETQFQARAQARFGLKFPGGRGHYTASYGVGGPSTLQMTDLAKAPVSKLDEKSSPARKRSRASRSELIDNAMGVTLEWRAELYRKCTEQVADLLDIELKKRREAMTAALAKMKDAPNSGWTKSDVPAEKLEEMRKNFVANWQSLGFSSAEDASVAWGKAEWSAQGVQFTVHWCDNTAPSNTIVIGGVEFAFSGW